MTEPSSPNHCTNKPLVIISAANLTLSTESTAYPVLGQDETVTTKRDITTSEVTRNRHLFSVSGDVIKMDS